MVDQDPQAGEQLARWLRDDGFRDDVAVSAAHALERLTHGTFTLALWDVGMKRMTGPEFIAGLPTAAGAVTVLATALPDQRALAAQCLDSGATGYLVKSIAWN